MNPLTALASIQAPDESQLTTRAQAALRMVESMEVSCQETYSLAADELKAIKAKAKSLEEQRTAITGPINQALKGINDMFRGPANFLDQAEKIIKGKMLGFQAEQERIAAEERCKAEEIAAAERRRLEAEAEEKRRAAEAEAAALRAKAEAEAAAGNAAAAAQAEQARQLVEQSAAAEVAAIVQTAQVITAPVLIAAPPKAAGISTAKSFDFEVEDLHALVVHIAAHPELISLVRPDDVKLRSQVRATGANTNLPGVRVFEKKTLRAA